MENKHFKRCTLHVTLRLYRKGTAAMRILFCLFTGITVTAALSSAACGADRPNILFIAVDDVRPQLGCYGEKAMVTPHLDRLAQQGRLFRRHYVQVPHLPFNAPQKYWSLNIAASHPGQIEALMHLLKRNHSQLESDGDNKP